MDRTGHGDFQIVNERALTMSHETEALHKRMASHYILIGYGVESMPCMIFEINNHGGSFETTPATTLG
ncbi:hypothetical protein PVAR5_0243 [Paecilomyces variotii No. 5]|uniref:Uncharacterized protein n=1 Tax=Byssochlamys spectabilis (strain No. 5 / NBRC 109023) TaxID=1356009 RepID=V5HQU2_BYSSN|nr:hypothetical protein PVAR5_0243 [Paecilomyces variotii No. 5]